MNKNILIICGSIIIVLISITLIALLILLPQETTAQGIAGEKYNKVNKTEYTYTPSKGITEEALIEEYKVNSEDLREGKADKNYNPGNIDPFAAQADAGTGTGTGTGTGGDTDTGK